MSGLRLNLTAERVAGFSMAVSVVLMEAFWVYPWLVWLGRWPALGFGRTPLSMPAILMLGGASFGLTRLLAARTWQGRALRLVTAGLGLLTVFVAVRIEYGAGYGLLDPGWFVYAARTLGESFSRSSALMVALPAAAYIWWRGMLLGRAANTFFIYSNLLFGAGSFVVLGLLWWASIGVPTPGDLVGIIGGNVAGFFFFGLLALALGNLAFVGRRLLGEEPGGFSYRRWLPLSLAASVIVLVAGVVFALIVSTDFVALVGRVVAAVGDFYAYIAPGLDRVVRYALLPLQYLAMVVMWVLNFIISLFRRRNIQEAAEEAAGEAEEQLSEITTGQAPEALIAMLKWLFFIAAAVIVTLLILHSLRSLERRRRGREFPHDFEEKRESVWSWRELGAGLVRLFRRLWGRLTHRPGRIEAPFFSQPIVQPDEPASTLHIRGVFQRLLREARRAGVPWLRHETPYEFAGRLSGELPELAAPVAELTSLYVRVRYSGHTAGDDQVRHANGIWRQVREMLRKRDEDRRQ